MPSRDIYCNLPSSTAWCCAVYAFLFVYIHVYIMFLYVKLLMLCIANVAATASRIFFSRHRWQLRARRQLGPTARQLGESLKQESYEDQLRKVGRGASPVDSCTQCLDIWFPLTFAAVLFGALLNFQTGRSSWVKLRVQHKGRILKKYV